MAEAFVMEEIRFGRGLKDRSRWQLHAPCRSSTNNASSLLGKIATSFGPRRVGTVDQERWSSCVKLGLRIDCISNLLSTRKQLLCEEFFPTVISFFCDPIEAIERFQHGLF